MLSERVGIGKFVGRFWCEYANYLLSIVYAINHEETKATKNCLCLWVPSWATSPSAWLQPPCLSSVPSSPRGRIVVVFTTNYTNLPRIGETTRLARMTIHRIRLLGDPILRTQCDPVEKPGSTAVRVILDDMRETLRDWQSRFG